MRSTTGAGIALLALCFGALVAGCTTQEDPVDRPEGAVALVQNQPTSVGDVTVVASNIREGSAAISVVGGAEGSAAQGGRVALGEAATFGDLTFEVVDIVLAQDRSGEPGSDTSTVWILPE
ncbi:hypothetical protein [Actinotalea sp. K2]|uniref:hypothetical protein n=1 Tax=Actinotalea sp. K2 TaxID=2939438 RepID=UPI002017E7AA|nr:hypothetical protein [Actinotalea sp. K2]MCL3860034.1 hypothetical protein [Actinotalea sp. K2]